VSSSERSAPGVRFEFERMIRHLQLSSTSKLVALMLATYAQGSSGDNAHPGEDRLAADCGLSKRTVRTHLALLRSSGLIRRTYKGRANQHSSRADVYELRLPTDVGSLVGTTPNHPALMGRRNRNPGPVAAGSEPALSRQHQGNLESRYRRHRLSLAATGHRTSRT
jgi:DNA-binding transcriptional ArsR family regulator